ncbi:MAG: 2-oxoadipate dioxygenase/decarboxylase family protein [Phycisphaerales bacterium]
MTTNRFADKVKMQHRLFSELSAMFGIEVPLYDKSLLVNKECNKAVCALIARLHPGFSVTEEQIDRTSGERHGAIRIGRPDEYRWVGRFFAQFAMEPHNFYDMTNVGSKSQPIIATAFRSVVNPEHRVFTSLLMTNYFDPATQERIEARLKERTVFSDRAKALIEKAERQGGLEWEDAEALIGEGTARIFKWTGAARDHGLYQDLSKAGFKIAADIACFERHHLNHLTPNTFCMDLYTSAMKFCMGELPESEFKARAERALGRFTAQCDKDMVRLLFRHLNTEQIDGFGRGAVGAAEISSMVASLAARLGQSDLQLSKLNHSGFKDFTEGPSEDTPVLLRQDAYKALTEKVVFTEADGSVIETVHTARFGEIEQRFYATTPTGRKMYDECLAAAEVDRDKDPTLSKRDFAAYERAYGSAFTPFPKTLAELLDRGLVYGRYFATASGRAARGALSTTDVRELVKKGFVRVEGLRYEDFLPVSAAGIFASNLNQYGTKSTAAVKPTYTRAMLEEILGKRIVDADAVYAGIEAQSVLATYEALGVTERVPAQEWAALRLAAEAAQSAGVSVERDMPVRGAVMAGV